MATLALCMASLVGCSSSDDEEELENVFSFIKIHEFVLKNNISSIWVFNRQALLLSKGHSSTLLQPFLTLPQPLLNPYSALTQPLLNPYSAIF